MLDEARFICQEIGVFYTRTSPEYGIAEQEGDPSFGTWLRRRWGTAHGGRGQWVLILRRMLRSTGCCAILPGCYAIMGKSTISI